MWDLLMKYEKFQNFRFIAEISNIAILAITLANLCVVKKEF